MQKIHKKIRKKLSEKIKKLPNTPGVYFFHDKYGRIIYVGKSIKIQTRIKSHIKEYDIEEEDRYRKMIFSISNISYIPVKTELLSLLLENRMIKKHMPEFNKKQRNYLNTVYLRLTDEAYPTLVKEEFKTDIHISKKENIFGPFKDTYFIEELKNIISEHLGLRFCTGSDPGPPCIKRQLSQCSGVCLNDDIKNRYSDITEDTVLFLRGDSDKILTEIMKKIKEKSLLLEFEKAKKLKNRYDFCERFVRKQKFTRNFIIKDLVLKEKCGKNSFTYIFNRGKKFLFFDSDLTKNNIQKELNALNNESEKLIQDLRYVLDEAYIISSWINSHKNIEYLFI